MMKRFTKGFLVAIGAALLARAPAFAFVADTMDTIVGWSNAESDSATVANALVTEGDQDRAVQLKYKFSGSSGYAQLTKDFSLYDMGEIYTPGSEFVFHYRATGPINRLKLLLTDTDGDQAYHLFEDATSSPSWNRIELTLSSFTVVSPAPAGGNGIFDFYRVKQIDFPIERSHSGGSGTLDIDKLELVRPVALSLNQSLDDFNGGPGSPFSPNAFSGSIGFSPATGTYFTVGYDSSTGNVYEGAYSFKITWDFSATTSTELLYYNSPNGNDLSAYRQIEFYAKSSIPNECFTLAFGSSSVSAASVKIDGVGTSWKKIVVPFLDYESEMREGSRASSITEFTFRIVKNLSSDAGTLWIDDLRFVRPEQPAASVQVVDDMEEPTTPALTSWNKFDDGKGSNTTLTSIPDGVDRNALRLTYTLADSLADLSTPFVGMQRKTMEPNASAVDGIKFRYMYSGDNNTLQFNVLDSKSVRFYSETQNLASTGGQWRTLSLPFSNFLPETTGSSLDLKTLKTVRFTVVFDNNGKGGEGRFAVDNLEFTNVPKNSISDNENHLIQHFALDNNPIHPNGRGVKETATFTYTLAESSFVRLRVYDTNGQIVREVRKSAPDPAGENTLTWDAGSDDGVRVPNGLYFYRFDAESVESDRKDDIKHVIGVLR